MTTTPVPTDPFVAAMNALEAVHVAAITALQATIASLEATIAAATLPAVPADVIYAPDRSYYLSTSGNDATADGTAAKPFASWGAAYAKLRADQAAKPAVLPAIVCDAASTFAVGGATWGNGVTGPLLVIGNWNAATVESRATFTAMNTAFSMVSASDVHFQHLRILTDPTTQGSYGIYLDGGNNVTLDYCEVSGFKAFDVDIIGAATNVRISHCFIANACDPSISTMSCSGLYTEAVRPVVYCSIFYHNGWQAPFNLSNAAEITAEMFRHGWYENPGNGASVSGTDLYNIYFRNACTGHQCRTGGSVSQWPILWDNGNATDLFGGPGFNNNFGCEIAGGVVFGNLTADFPSYGGGVAGQSIADNIHDLIFLGGLQSMQLPAAISISWGGGNALAAVPLPSGTTAIVSNCRGTWKTGDVSIATGRTATVTNVNIRKPLATETIPTLLDYLTSISGTPITTDDQAANFLRANLHNPATWAPAIIAWARVVCPS